MDRLNRMDEHAESQYEAMGYDLPLPDAVVRTYLEFKRQKDILQPGRLTPGELVTVLFLAGFIDKQGK
jgi:hypothetical protein